ncbi:MAG: penicillin acylase family protein [Parvularculaceae bacterium]
MGKILRWAGLLLLAAVAAAALYLKTPSPRFNAKAAIAVAADYDARIIRDRFGVPHIYGKRDADVAFGLAYAHAEDDWKTIEEVILFSRGDLARRDGKDAAVTDYLIRAMGSAAAIAARYETDLSDQTRAVAEGYAAGVNFYCAEKSGRCDAIALPVSGRDVIAGFASRTPFFYGLDDNLTALFAGDVDVVEKATRAREAYLRVPKEFEIGSNAMAVSPVRSADGHTRLMVNSHQPYTGPVAWYEARVKSGEGWDMIGGIFPGSP